MQFLSKFNSDLAFRSAIWLALFFTIALGMPFQFTPTTLTFAALLAGILTWTCIVDLQDHRIPNLAVLAILISGIIYTVTQDYGMLAQRLIEALCGVLIFFVVNKLLAHLLPIKVFGFGDIKLLAASILWIGLYGAFQALFIASVLGLLVSIGAALFKKRPMRLSIPFGPFLSIGLWVVWLNLAT